MSFCLSKHCLHLFFLSPYWSLLDISSWENLILPNLSSPRPASKLPRWIPSLLLKHVPVKKHLFLCILDSQYTLLFISASSLWIRYSGVQAYHHISVPKHLGSHKCMLELFQGWFAWIANEITNEKQCLLPSNKLKVTDHVGLHPVFPLLESISVITMDLIHIITHDHPTNLVG